MNPYGQLARSCVGLLLTLSVIGCDRFVQQDPNFERTADAPALIAAAQAETPLPSNSTFQPIRFNKNDAYEKGYFTFAVQWQAQCKWFMYWLKGYETRDQAIQNEAVTMLRTIHTWLVYTNADQSYRTLIDSIERKADLGDPTGIREYVRLNCREINP